MIFYLNETNEELRNGEEPNHESGSHDASEVESQSAEDWGVAGVACLPAEVPSNSITTDAEAEELFEECKSPVELNEDQHRQEHVSTA